VSDASSPTPPAGDVDAPVVQTLRPVGRLGRGKEKSAVFRAVAAVGAPLFDSLARIEVRGGEKLPIDGPFVLAPNHYTNIDPVVVARVMWRRGGVPRFLAKASLFRVPVFGSLMRAMGHVPVERGGRTHASDPLQAGRALATSGGGVIIYPEGTLTRDPDLWPMRGKSGAVRLALQAGVPLVPMAHWGSQQVMGRYSAKISLFPRKRIVAAIGDPVDLSPWRGRPLDQAAYTEATALVMQRITELLEGLRDEEAPVERWDPHTKNQKETGRFEQS
jgi:1-acyl-sn-glycerol-3-phosphate acyltransferase